MTPNRRPAPDTRHPIPGNLQYWDELGGLSGGKHRQPLWRVHSDAVNCAWLARWLLPASGRLLKTDLFDEALTAGLYPFLTAHAHVVGVDVAASTVRAARVRHAGLPGATADVRTLPFVAGAFDVVVSTSTLDHFGSMADIATSLSELHRVLRSDGQLFLTLDNLANPIVALRNALPFRLLNALGIVPYRVGTTCGPRRLQRAVTEAGFDVHDVAAVLHCPRVFAVGGAAIINRFGSSRAQRHYVRWLMPFEGLGRWPSRFLTGYYTGIVARKR